MPDTEHAKRSAVAYMEEITEMANTLSHDEFYEKAMEMPLSVEYRSSWQPVNTQLVPDEFQILLCWGGPAVRIVGDIYMGEPRSARLEYQDWGTEWTQLYIDADREQPLLDRFCNCFLFPLEW